ncbi:hypothetical protein [Sinorhizobium terangae]|uniref:hypothetical protein n=1 Tax=Sinorhizobium terangae TaxID=110322 RepID=UPI0024B06546|nr:hypothetical protein [Sinorhizobium terangae]WFU51723.1 hypothetical protein QA637_30110 [Sinorhizobium terangae]
MDYIAEIKGMTDDELRATCMLAVAHCVTDEMLDDSMPPYWIEILKEIYGRGWAGDNQEIIAEKLAEATTTF